MNILKLHFTLLLYIISLAAGAQSLSPATLSGLASHSLSGNTGLSATMGQPFSSQLAAGKSILTEGFQQPQIQINTDTLSFATICAGEVISIPYIALGYVDAANIFTAQLSDSTGSFAHAQNTGTVTGIASGTITATIPTTLASGNNYLVRVVSSAPVFNGKANPGGYLPSTICIKGRNPSPLHALPLTTGKISLRLDAVFTGNKTPYTIERSTDGVNFEVIETRGETQTLSTVNEVIDENPPRGLIYYRLVEKPDNGSTAISETVSVTTGLPDNFYCYPNPTLGLVYITLPKDITGKISIYDISGKLIEELPCNGQENMRLDIFNLASGVYLATYQNAEISRSARIVKQ